MHTQYSRKELIDILKNYAVNAKNVFSLNYTIDDAGRKGIEVELKQAHGIEVSVTKLSPTTVQAERTA